MQRISIFGATGSIGSQTLSLIENAGGAEAYKVVALTGGRNVAQLAKSARDLRAEVAVISDESQLGALREALAGSGVEAAAGAQAISEAADRPCDWGMSSIIGAAGLVPSLKIAQQGATLALANKESLVTAGPLLLATAAQAGAKILPVDSEHSAVFQALVGENSAEVEEITLTASGGAFRDWPLERLATASVAEASTHPNFAMGQRITIDSATMFNKAMEVIEAKEFFGFSADQIKVIIQREQIIHALVSYQDGAVMAHLGAPDMRHAIGYALHWPKRENLPVARLDLASLGQLSFAAPDLARYPALGLAQAVMRQGGLYGAVFNAAKEKALDHFIAGGIGFMQMAALVEATLDRLSREPALARSAQNLDDVLAADALARQSADAIAATWA